MATQKSSGTVKRKSWKKVTVNTAKLVQIDEEAILLVPVKLCYRKSTSPLGSGRFGVVSLAKVVSIYTKAEEEVKMSEEALAVKTISLRKGSLKELSILQSLDHPNIVKLLLYHKSDKELHLLCQKMAVTLYDKLDHEGAFDLEETLLLALQLFRALEYLEEEFVLHRDIKPTNILLNEALKHLKLCDFGCAQRLDNESSGTYSSYMCSRFYRAPELLLGLQNYDYKVDIWSAGCVVVEMLTARPLFRGDSGVDQLVEIVSTVGPFTPSDFQLMGIDESFPLVDVVAQYRSPIRRLSKSTFEERFVASTSSSSSTCKLSIPSDMITSLFQNIFTYVPGSRWSAEKILHWLAKNIN